MKAISLWQPWAQAMALGWKRNETRSWPTSHRGDLVICASKRKLDEVAYSVARCHGFNFDDIKLGVAVCVVEVIACVRTQDMTLLPDDREAALGDYSFNRFAWVTKNLRVLKTPVPVVGRQGLWDLPEDVAQMVREAMVITSPNVSPSLP